MSKLIKKSIAYIVALIFSTFSLFTFVGCDMGKLDAPSGLKYANNKLEWNYVDAAIEYVVNIDGSEYLTANNYYDLSTLNLISGNEYRAKVKAKADGYLKKSSDYSQELVFKYSALEEEINLSEDEIKSIVNSNSLSDAYFGIGRSINAIEDEYATFSANILSRQKVFDFNKLSNLKWIKAKVGKMESRIITEKTAKDYYEKFNDEIQSKFRVGGSYDLFSASIDSTFSAAQSSAHKSASNEIYNTFEQVCGVELVAIDEYANVSQYKNVLSEAFLNEALLVTNEETAKAFINKFGTHIVTAGYFGGKISFNYYLSNSDAAWDKNKSNQISLAVSAGISGLCDVSNSNQWSGASSLGLSESKTFEQFQAFTVGGHIINATSIDSFMQNYDSWIDFINNKEDYSSVLVEYAEDSLIEVWELLPEEYSDIKVIIKTAFENMAVEKNTRLYEKYYREKIDTTPITNSLDIKSCLCDTNFNANKPEQEELVYTSHEEFEMGELVLYGCSVNQDGKYSLHNENDFAIKYHILENPKNLPKSNMMINNRVEEFLVHEDSATKIEGCNDFNQTIGYGASYVKFTYKNGTNKTVKLSNILKDKSKGDYVEFAGNTYAGNIQTIEVVVVYELFFWWWKDANVHIFSGEKYPNFRTSYTYYFV